MTGEEIQPQKATLFKELIADLAKCLKRFEMHLLREQRDFKLQLVLLELFKRAVLGTNAIDKLTDSFIKDSSFKFPICILLRTLIADAIIVTYLTDPIEDDSYSQTVPVGHVNFNEDEKERFHNRYEFLTGEAISKVKRRIDELVKNEVMSSEEGKEIWEGWQTRFSSCFESNGNIKKNSSSGVKPLIEGIEDSVRKDFARKLYSSYYQLSQYEHFSELTVQMMQIDSQGAVDEAADQMLVSLWLILRGIRGLLLCLNQGTESMDELIGKMVPLVERYE